MKINNALDLYNLAKNQGLINLDPDITAMCQCVEQFNRLCACDPPAVKNAKLNQCKVIYVNFIHKSSQYKNQLFSKISDNSLSFTVDGQIVTTLTR